MENNITRITQVVDYIEEHIDERLNLDKIAFDMGYSKYHLHRMFTNIVGYSMHSYIQRRRLTEAVRELVFTNRSIMDIALASGYETQQSFSVAFKAMFRCSPKRMRKNQRFYPLQLPFVVDGRNQVRGDMVMDIRTETNVKLNLIGYTGNTKKGFRIIGKCMKQLIKNQNKIMNRVEKNCLIALNDYSVNRWEEGEQPNFDFYGVAQVSDFSVIPKGMTTKELPESNYVVFSFLGNPEDSMQPVADYIYKEWFPQSTATFNEHNMIDFSKSYEETDHNGLHKIEYWVPII